MSNRYREAKDFARFAAEARHPVCCNSALGHCSTNSTIHYIGMTDGQLAGETARALMALYGKTQQ